MYKMPNKKVLITGATSGIGLLVAKKCIKKGYEVYAIGRNGVALAELQSHGVHTFQADLNDQAQLEHITNELPIMNVAILNAGVGTFEVAYKVTDQQLHEMMNINVYAPIYMARKIATKMMPQNKGHLIFISSQAGKVATKKASIYAASKHAITGFINGYRMELKEHNIMVTGIYPGPIDTPFLDKADAKGGYRNAMKAFLLKPDDVANAIMKVIERPVREVNLPKVMAITSKLYAVAPRLVEFVGKGFFNKK